MNKQATLKAALLAKHSGMDSIQAFIRFGELPFVIPGHYGTQRAVQKSVHRNRCKVAGIARCRKDWKIAAFDWAR